MNAKPDSVKQLFGLNVENSLSGKRARNSISAVDKTQNISKKRIKKTDLKIGESNESDIQGITSDRVPYCYKNKDSTSRTCSRVVPYDSKERASFYAHLNYLPEASVELTAVASNTVTRNLRQQNGVKLDSSADGRAARANQRRMLKDEVFSTKLLAFGMLAAREPQLRFGRSKIHAWGVFAEEPISKGDLIMEYRGEIIGIAVSNAREIEYERENVGSDYMFRIDSVTVCDATKQGNMARFINASCDPNCYTKIINVMDTKRIVIYAKRKIMVGEELCYDYKFQLECDEKKRIPCYCGARKCKGFMNWVSPSETDSVLHQPPLHTGTHIYSLLFLINYIE